MLINKIKTPVMSDDYKTHERSFLCCRFRTEYFPDEELEMIIKNKRTGTVIESINLNRIRGMRKFGKEKQMSFLVYKEKTFNKEKKKKKYIEENEQIIDENNKGFQMLKKLGWKPGQGLGCEGNGMVDPINLKKQKSKRGLGHKNKSNVEFNK